MGKEEMAGGDDGGAYFADAEIRNISLSPLPSHNRMTFQAIMEAVRYPQDGCSVL